MAENLGPRYVDGTGVDLEKSFEESGPATPIFFILSPGVNPLKDVESLGAHYTHYNMVAFCLWTRMQT